MTIRGILVEVLVGGVGLGDWGPGGPDRGWVGVRLPGARSDSNPGPRTLGLEPRDRTRARAWGGSWDAVDVSDSRERYVCSRILLYCIVLYS